MSESEARRPATAEFGEVAVVKERVRDPRGGAFLESVVQDLVHAWRGLRRAPRFAAVVIATLTLGVASNAAIFGS